MSTVESVTGMSPKKCGRCDRPSGAGIGQLRTRKKQLNGRKPSGGGAFFVELQHIDLGGSGKTGERRKESDQTLSTSVVVD